MNQIDVNAFAQEKTEKERSSSEMCKERIKALTLAKQ